MSLRTYVKVQELKRVSVKVQEIENVPKLQEHFLEFLINLTN